MMSFGMMPYFMGAGSLMNFFTFNTGTFNMAAIDKARKLNSRAKAQKRGRIR